MDLNILISSIITGTSSLVAIIGGFLVSRVISLSSEQSAIEKRLKEINNDISIKKDMYEKSSALLLAEDVDDFILENIKNFVFTDKSVEQLLDEGDYDGLTAEKLEPFIKLFNSVKDEVIKIINEYDKDTISKDFDDIINGKSDLNIPDKKYWYELVYDEIYESLPREQPLNSFSLPQFMHNPTYNQKHITPVIEQQRYREMVKDCEKLSNDLIILSAQQKEQQELLSYYGTPHCMWSGLGVLMYACIVGIVFPSLLLPYPIEYYNNTTIRWILLGLFFSELVVLFIYLGLSLYRLTDYRK